MTDIIPQILDQIKRNPHINKIRVKKVEWLLIKREIRKMSRVKPSKRPIYGPPFGNVDKELWDANFKYMRDITPVYIMNIPVTYYD